MQAKSLHRLSRANPTKIDASPLKQIHDDLDAAVAYAYGWPTDLTDEQILQKLEPGIESGARAGEEKTRSARRIRGHRNGPMPRLTVER